MSAERYLDELAEMPTPEQFERLKRAKPESSARFIGASTGPGSDWLPLDASGRSSADPRDPETEAHRREADRLAAVYQRRGQLPPDASGRPSPPDGDNPRNGPELPLEEQLKAELAERQIWDGDAYAPEDGRGSLTPYLVENESDGQALADGLCRPVWFRLTNGRTMRTVPKNQGERENGSMKAAAESRIADAFCQVHAALRGES